MKPVKSRKPFAFKRDAPDLPAELESSAARSQDLDRTNQQLDTLRLEDSVLDRVHLAGGQFGSAIWKDVRLVACDLANVRAHRISLVRVELIDCRLTGFRATALDWHDVLIQNGDLRYAQFQSGSFRNCEFDGCNLQDADLQGADLAGSVLRSCNLARADLRRAKLRNTDLRKSELDGMLVGMSDLQGAIVDPAQAMVLAQLLGLQIS
jgi:uncharacterized protein YjbI with pentapeptide repeats